MFTILLLQNNNCDKTKYLLNIGDDYKVNMGISLKTMKDLQVYLVHTFYL